jgi:hypothetical protein
MNKSAHAASASCFLLGKRILNCFHASMKKAATITLNATFPISDRAAELRFT